MNFNYQSRKYNLTFNQKNNEVERSYIQENLAKSCPIYFCMADEIASTGTLHTHVFVNFHSPIRFSTLKKRFPTAHIEKAKGTPQQNRDYIRKEGKWANTDKAETSVEGSFFEAGDISVNKSTDRMEKLIADVKSGETTACIIEATPSFAFKSNEINVLRETFLAEKYQKVNREVELVYLFGEPNSGKTKYVYENHAPENICRIVHYGGKNGVKFDSYHGQDVLVFENFDSQIPIEELLLYLDVYPCTLPARYSDRTACYTKVYIISTLPITDQYVAERRNRPETWKAFYNRVGKIFYCSNGNVEEIEK